MPGGATGRYSNPEDYEAALGWLRAELIMGSVSGFKATLTRAALPNLTVVCAKESLARTAYLTLPRGYVCVSLPMQTPSRIVNDGVPLGSGELIFHEPGEQTHQRLIGPTHWGLLVLAGGAAPAHGATQLGQRSFSLPVGCVVRPLAQDHRRLAHLLVRIIQLAEARMPDEFQPEMADELQRDLLHALQACIDAGQKFTRSETIRQHAEMMGRFELVLGRELEHSPTVPDLCAMAGLQERTLRTCCSAFLGFSPARYMTLRRLRLVRAELQAATKAEPRVGEIAKRHGFGEVGRFASTYRSVFGEVPSTTKRRGDLPR